MDTEANQKEQIEVADEIMRIWDECPYARNFKEWQERDLIRHAYRLAELVIALHESKYNRNPPA